ncbi:histidine phosphatase family protein [Gracilinema caldarium]|uniref:Phosphoglycerate mutase n=1 Tax=Gracilinema caldarium (strain ATCC 51460 / DSM 7334 / H1) TaxID=744872 RepID=F8F316_GRAC1|nr:histidine phosphatase family protein [Gracilinema caldarium]AEJ19924.1 Phosphoglycerate mutase [Gracilinema caldarium DSM 7334]
MYSFIFIRHGHSQADVENAFEGRLDMPLTDLGKNQAKTASEKLIKMNYKFDKIICSPLKRAKETANIINEKYHLEIIENDLLIEQDNGILTGQNKKLMEIKYPIPKFINPFRKFPENTGESDFELHARAGFALNSLMDNKPGTYLIVSHGRILNALIRNILQIPIPINNTGVYFGFGDIGLIDLIYKEDEHKWFLMKFEESLS